jgi:hypothetical protein
MAPKRAQFGFSVLQKGVSVMALIPLDLRQGDCIFGKSGHWHNAFRGKALSGRTVNLGAILVHRYAVTLGDGLRGIFRGRTRRRGSEPEIGSRASAGDLRWVAPAPMTIPGVEWGPGGDGLARRDDEEELILLDEDQFFRGGHGMLFQ